MEISLKAHESTSLETVNNSSKFPTSIFLFQSDHF